MQLVASRRQDYHIGQLVNTREQNSHQPSIRHAAAKCRFPGLQVEEPGRPERECRQVLASCSNRPSGCWEAM